jgi:hypothetical protein
MKRTPMKCRFETSSPVKWIEIMPLKEVTNEGGGNSLSPSDDKTSYRRNNSSKPNLKESNYEY